MLLIQLCRILPLLCESLHSEILQELLMFHDKISPKLSGLKHIIQERLSLVVLTQ